MRRRPGGHGAGGELQSPGCVQQLEATGSDSRALDRLGSRSPSLVGPRAPRKAGIGFVVYWVCGGWSSRPWWRRLPPCHNLPKIPVLAFSLSLYFLNKMGVLAWLTSGTPSYSGRHKFHDFNVKSVF